MLWGQKHRQLGDFGGNLLNSCINQDKTLLLDNSPLTSKRCYLCTWVQCSKGFLNTFTDCVLMLFILYKCIHLYLMFCLVMNDGCCMLNSSVIFCPQFTPAHYACLMCLRRDNERLYLSLFCKPITSIRARNWPHHICIRR